MHTGIINRITFTDKKNDIVVCNHPHVCFVTEYTNIKQVSGIHHSRTNPTLLCTFNVIFKESLCKN